MRTISENLRARRLELKAEGKPYKLREITARVQAHGIEVLMAAVGHWFTGKREPGVHELYALAAAMETDIDRLAKGVPHIATSGEDKKLMSLIIEMPLGEKQALMAYLEAKRATHAQSNASPEIRTEEPRGRPRLLRRPSK